MSELLDKALASTKRAKLGARSLDIQGKLDSSLAAGKAKRLQIASDTKQNKLRLDAELDSIRESQLRAEDRGIRALTDSITGVAKGFSTIAGSGIYEAANQLSAGQLAPYVKAYEAITGKPSPARSLDEGLSSIGLSPDFARTNQAIDETFKSDVIRSRQEGTQGEVQRISAAADAKLDALGDSAQFSDQAANFFEKLTGTVSAYASNPSVAADAAVESIPQLLQGGALAKATGAFSKGAATVYIGASEGLSAGSGVREEILKTSFEDLAESSEEFSKLVAAGDSPERVRRELAEKGSLIATAITATLAVGASKLTGTDKLVGDLFKPSSKLGKQLSSNFVVNTAKGAASEGFEELLQGGGGEFASNISKKLTVNDDQDLLDGVAESAGQGLVVGALSGGAVVGVKELVEAADQGTTVIAKKVNQKLLERSGVSKSAQKAFSEGKLDEVINKDIKTVQDSEDKTIALLGSVPVNDPDKIKAHLTQVLGSIAALSKANKGETGDKAKKRQERIKGYFSQLKQFSQPQIKKDSDETKAFVENLPDSKAPETSGQVDSALNVFGSAPRETKEAAAETLAQAEKLLASGLSNPKQTTRLNEIIATLKTYDEVTEEVFNGSKDSGFTGINQHQDIISNSVELGETELATDTLNELKTFTKGHKDKLTQFEEALPAWNKREKKEGDLSQQETAAIEKLESRPSQSGKGTYEIQPGSFKLMEQIRLEVAALEAAVSQSENLIANPTAKPSSASADAQVQASVSAETSTTKPESAVEQNPVSNRGETSPQAIDDNIAALKKAKDDAFEAVLAAGQTIKDDYSTPTGAKYNTPIPYSVSNKLTKAHELHDEANLAYTRAKDKKRNAELEANIAATDTQPTSAAREVVSGPRSETTEDERSESAPPASKVALEQELDDVGVVLKLLGITSNGTDTPTEANVRKTMDLLSAARKTGLTPAIIAEIQKSLTWFSTDNRAFSDERLKRATKRVDDGRVKPEDAEAHYAAQLEEELTEVLEELGVTDPNLPIQKAELKVIRFGADTVVKDGPNKGKTNAEVLTGLKQPKKVASTISSEGKALLENLDAKIATQKRRIEAADKSAKGDRKKSIIDDATDTLEVLEEMREEVVEQRTVNPKVKERKSRSIPKTETAVESDNKIAANTAEKILAPHRVDDKDTSMDRAIKKLTKLITDYKGDKKGTAMRTIKKAIDDAIAGKTNLDNTDGNYLIGTEFAKSVDLFQQYGLNTSILSNSANTDSHTVKSGKNKGQLVNEGVDSVLSASYSAKTQTNGLLQTVRNLFRRGHDNDSVFGELNADQKAALPTLKKFNQAFKSIFFNKVLKLRENTAYAYQDTFQFFIAAGADPKKLKDSLDENLVSAMAMVGLNLVATQSGASITNYKSDINGILLRDSKARVRDAEYGMLSDVGTLRSLIISSLGKEVFAALGISVNTDEHGQVQSNLENALGTMVLATLVHSGLVVQTSVERDMMDLFKHTYIPSMEQLSNSLNVTEGVTSDSDDHTDILVAIAKYLKDNKHEPTFMDTIYVTIPAKNKKGKDKQIGMIYFPSPDASGASWKRQSAENTPFIRTAVKPNPELADQEVPADKVQAYIDTIKDSDGVLTELFGLQSRATEPSATAPTEAPKTILNSWVDVPSKLRAKIKQIQKRAFGFHEAMFDVLDTMGRDAALATMGYNFTYEQDAHKVHRLGIKAKNASIVKAYEDILAFREKHGNNPFYFALTVWKSMRMGLDSNTVNPQTDKAQRFMMGMESHEVEIDPNNREHMIAFSTAVAQGFGISIDKDTTEGNMQAFNDLVINYPELEAAMKAIRTGIDPDAITTFVAQSKEGLHSLAALIAYTDYMNAKGKPFKTTLTKEIDGVTNGVAIGLMQLMVMLPAAKHREMLERTGIFLGKHESFGEWIQDPLNQDSYQNMARDWAQRIEQKALNVKNGKDSGLNERGFLGIQNLIGKLTEIDENGDTVVTALGRSLVKNPQMITNYGSGMDKVIDSFIEDRLDNIYKLIAKANKDNPNQITQIVFDINSTLSADTTPIDESDVYDDPLNWEMPFEVMVDLSRAIDNTVGTTLKDSIEEEFGEFISHRRELVKATTIMFEAFKLRYEAGYAQLVKKSKGNLPSKDAMKQLNETLLDSMPMLRGFFSETNRDGILVMKTKEVPVDRTNPKFVTDTKLGTPLPSKRKGNFGQTTPDSTATIKTYATKTEIEDGGVGGPIAQIHNMDATTIINTLEKFAAINVHDAAIFSILETNEGGQFFNEQFLEAMKGYSMNQEVYDALTKSMNELGKSDRNNKTNYQKTLSENIYLGKYEDGSAISLKDFLRDFEQLTIANEHKRNEFIPQIRKLDQYTGGQGTTHTPNDTDATLEEALTAFMGPPAPKEIGIDNVAAAVLKALDIDAPNSLGSSSDGTIDPNDFSARQEQKVTKLTVEQVYDTLGKGDHVKDSTEHDTHLRNVLATLVSKVMRPLKVHMATRGDKNEGIYNANTGSIYMHNAIANGMAALSSRMSQREVYVHELMHHITNTAIDSDTVAANKLNRLYNRVRDSGKISAETFMEGDYQEGDPGYDAELKVAQERYDYIFGTKIGTRTVTRIDPITGKKTHQKLRTHHHEFLAFGMTNAGFRKALSEIKADKAFDLGLTRDDFAGNFGESLWTALTKLLTHMIEYVSSMFTGTRSANSEQALTALAGQLAGIDVREKSRIWQQVSNAGGVYNKGTAMLGKLSVKAYNSIVNSTFLTKNRFEVVRKTARLLNKGRHLAELPRGVSKVFDYAGVKEENLATSLVNELRGQDESNTDVHQLGRKSNKEVDQLRSTLIKVHSEQVTEAFLTTLSEKQSHALSKIIMKVDISVLFPANAEGVISYDKDTLIKYLADPVAVKAEIDSISKELRADYSTNATWYINMATNLGYHMATGRGLYNFVLMNANVIAQMDTTGRKTEGDLAKAEQLIDRLASLVAITKTDARHRKNAVVIIKSEFEANADNNGIINAIEMYSAAKAAAMEISFKSGKDKKLAVKGYTKELLNPNKDFKVAPESHKEAMLAKGYTIGEQVRKDPNDPNPKEVLFMYVSTNGAPATLQAGITSFTNESGKGHNTLDIYSELGEFDPAKSAAMDKPFIDTAKKKVIDAIFNGTASKLKDSEGSLVPTLDSDGNIANWRYMMSEHAKDTLLDKDNSLSHIMGATIASITDKHNTEIINAEVVDLLHKQFTADKGKNETYVEIGPNSPIAKYQEVYHMLPDKMRRKIRTVTGTDRIFVKRDEASLLFGTRKISLSQLSKVKITDQKGMELVRAQMKNIIATVFGHRYAIIIERIWQELIKYVKDAIVIKSGVVLLGNFISNVLVLLVSGVSLKDMATNHYRGVKHAREFENAQQELLKLKLASKLPSTKKGTHDVRIADLQDIIDNSPIKDLFDAGVHQSIIEDIDDTVNAHSYQSQLGKIIGNTKIGTGLANKTPQFLKSIGKNLVMTHDTGIYEFMKKTTQLSDFVARFVLHEHNKKKGMDSRESINQAVDLFINYDLPTHRFLQYANDIGLVMFSKFTIRIQKVILVLARKNPGGLLATILGQEALINVSDITDSLLLTGGLSGKINTDPLDLILEILDAPLTVVGELMD